MMNEIDHESLVKGSIMGHLIGDALGYPYTNKKISPSNIDMIEGEEGEPAGAYQGPGTLSLCTMSSINELHGIDTSDILERFNDFVIGGYLTAVEDCSDVSEATIAAIKNFNNGMPPDKCGLREDEFNDNECLARMLPIALYCVTDPIDHIIDTAHAVCEITHAQVKSKVTCALYCLIIRSLLLQKSEKVFELLDDYYQTKGMQDFSDKLNELKSWKNGEQIVKQSTEGRNVEDCFWSAWASHAQFEHDYKICVTSAISLGNDANSTGAVAGSISALVNGLSNIPTSWLQTIILTSEVMEVIMTFTDSVVKKINK